MTVETRKPETLATKGKLSNDPVALATKGVLTADQMTIEAAVRTVLLTDTTVAAIVAARIYPNQMPQKALAPAIVYQVISDVPDKTLGGDSCLVTARFQLKCWALTYRATRDLAAAVKNRLDFYSGVVNGVNIQAVSLENTLDLPKISAETSQLTRYGRLLDFIVCYDEP